MLAAPAPMRTVRGMKRSRIALSGIILPLLAGCSKTTTVTERRDRRAPGGSSVEVEERWGIAEPARKLFEFYLDAMFLQDGVLPFLIVWGWTIYMVMVVGSVMGGRE